MDMEGEGCPPNRSGFEPVASNSQIVNAWPECCTVMN